MPRLSNLYLFTYNFAQTIGWAVALIQILIGFTSTKSFNGAFASSGQIICLLQKAAFLEVIHGALGIVPSGVLLPLMQWGGRSHYLLAIAGKIVELQTSPSIFITFVAWSISEIIRYSNYALSCIGDCPYWSTYVRYTVFIPLYPVGVAGETHSLSVRKVVVNSVDFHISVWLMYQALTYIKEKDLYRDFFSVLPFSYHTFVQVEAFLLYCGPDMF
uniref:Very-long-chain (3R)-3-hydroxyacyl-CoA dehydratase n=1 Tax=Chenopodium quinoa TaxID=63459 RepID=A0A803KS32_CHEQI